LLSAMLAAPLWPLVLAALGTLAAALARRDAPGPGAARRRLVRARRRRLPGGHRGPGPRLDRARGPARRRLAPRLAAAHPPPAAPRPAADRAAGRPGRDGDRGGAVGVDGARLHPRPDRPHRP